MVHAWINMFLLYARVLIFHIYDTQEKIVDPCFFPCPSYAPFLNYTPLEAKFENLVCKITKKSI